MECGCMWRYCPDGCEAGKICWHDELSCQDCQASKSAMVATCFQHVSGSVIFTPCAA